MHDRPETLSAAFKIALAFVLIGAASILLFSGYLDLTPEREGLEPRPLPPLPDALNRSNAGTYAAQYFATWDRNRAVRGPDQYSSYQWDCMADSVEERAGEYRVALTCAGSYDEDGVSQQIRADPVLKINGTTASVIDQGY